MKSVSASSLLYTLGEKIHWSPDMAQASIHVAIVETWQHQVFSVSVDVTESVDSSVGPL